MDMIRVSKCQNIALWLIGDRLIQVKYNKISRLGILNGDCVCSIEVTVLYRSNLPKGTDFGEFNNSPLNGG